MAGLFTGGGPEWAWYSRNRSDHANNNVLAETLSTPFLVYSRAWARLNAKLAGGDAGNIPEKTCNHDCASCVACFPCEWDEPWGGPLTRLPLC